MCATFSTGKGELLSEQKSLHEYLGKEAKRAVQGEFAGVILLFMKLADILNPKNGARPGNTMVYQLKGQRAGHVKN